MQTRFSPFSLLALTGALAVVLVSCSTVPMTGRKQFNFISADEEMQLGLSSFEELKKSTPISRDPAANAMVQRVGQRVAKAAANDLPNAQWEFVVFESPEANAFCLPGGKVGVYTGILKITKDDAGLAAVIGHEVAHATARHGAERMSEAMLMQTGGAVLGSTLSKSDPKTQAAASTAYGLLTSVGRELPHSRDQESEADRMGLSYMARAGYDPEASVGFWERFAEFNRLNGGSAGLSFLRTHPLDEVRIRQIKGWLPEAKAQFRAQ